MVPSRSGSASASFTRRCWSSSDRSAKRGLATVTWKWSPPPVRSSTYTSVASGKACSSRAWSGAVVTLPIVVPVQQYMSASGPRSRGARVHPRPWQGRPALLRSSAVSGLVLTTQKLDGITGRALATLVRQVVEEVRAGQDTDRLPLAGDDEGVRAPRQRREHLVERDVAFDRGKWGLHRSRDVFVERVRILEHTVEQIAVLERPDHVGEGLHVPVPDDR